MDIKDALKSVVSKFSSRGNKLPDDSEVFCMAPWLQLHAQTNGEITPCCIAAFKGETIGNLRENPNLAEAWNSDGMKQLRLNMLQGKRSVMCGNCYEDEKLGKTSERIKFNRDFKGYYERVSSTFKDGSVPFSDVPILDIRFSNRCNYKCRICNSSNSSLLRDEELKLGWISEGVPKEVKVANDEGKFWNSFVQLLPGVKRIHFAGGEPLVMEEHYQTLEHLIAIGNTDVALTYNTNFSTLRFRQYDVIKLWNQFWKVDVWASLDGIGVQGDYQRKGQRWNVIEENIRTLQRECAPAQFGIDATASIFNILHIPKFYQYMVENNFIQPNKMNLYYLREPECFCITNLTPSLKRQAGELYDNFFSYLEKLAGGAHVKQHASAVIKFMMSANTSKQAEFQSRISKVDVLRNENFNNVFPELAGMMSPALHDLK